MAPSPGSASAAGARTHAFFVLALLPLAHAFNCRTRRTSLFSSALPGNAFLWLAVVSSAALQLVAILVPALHGVFRIVPLGLRDWLMLVAASIAVVPVWEIVKVFLRRRDRVRASAAG